MFDKANVSVLAADCTSTDFTGTSSLWGKNKNGTDIASIFSGSLYRQVLHKKFTKTEGSWQRFVRVENDKLKEKLRSPEAAEKMPNWEKSESRCNVLLFCSCHTLLSTGKETVLIKEVSHLLKLWRVADCFFPRGKPRSNYDLYVRMFGKYESVTTVLGWSCGLLRLIVQLIRSLVLHK